MKKERMPEEVKGIIFCSWRDHLNWGGREGGETKVHVQRFGGGQERLGEQPIECDKAWKVWERRVRGFTVGTGVCRNKPRASTTFRNRNFILHL